MADEDKSQQAVELHTDNSHRATRTWTFSNALIKYCFFLIYIQASPGTVNYECNHHLLFLTNIRRLNKFFQDVSYCVL